MERLVPFLSIPASLVTIFLGWVRIKKWQQEERERKEKGPGRNQDP